MNARQIRTTFHYTIGRVYQLKDLQELVGKLKTISSRTVNGQIFHLYREIGTHKMWMEGPFKGEGTSGFMYLGPRKTKSQLNSFLVRELKTFLKDMVDQSTKLLLSSPALFSHGTQDSSWEQDSGSGSLD